MARTKPYKVVDLFSGAGGFSLGFEQPSSLNTLSHLDYTAEVPGPGFETVLCVEANERARETFKLNFPSVETRGDIRNIESFEEWGDADVVIGGPPCQDFSNLNSGRLETSQDARNALWTEYMRAVEDIEPEVFVLENVEGFLTSFEGRAALETAEQGLGYDVISGTLWANEHGVPQKRKRAFIIGSKHAHPFFPEPNEERTRTVHDAIVDLPKEPTGKNWHRGRNVQQITEERMEMIPYGGDRRNLNSRPELLPDCWKGDYSGHTDCYGRLRWEEPSVTIRTGFYQPMKGRHLHPVADRTITPREGARLQTFPDTFEFASDAKTHVARQIGNAVPPKLAYEIAVSVALHLDEHVAGVPNGRDSTAPSLTEASPTHPIHDLQEQLS